MKRIVCSLDGTWNDDRSGSVLTNVAKLHRAILPVDRAGVRQIVRYVAGIATTEGERAQFLKGAVGIEVGDRIKAGYTFLSKTYEPGDEIFLFGFSRGAFEARSLASFATLFGVARKDSDFPIDEAWKIYRQPDHSRDVDALARLSAACHYPVRVRCLGVWDTVGNIGNPFYPAAWINRFLAFHDMRLHDTIDVALHALSIDEIRGPFRPTLFTLPADVALTRRQHVEQVWFPGTHADVGGGWPETELSDGALLWMAERVGATTGLAFDVDKLKRRTTPNPLGLQHDSATGWMYAVSRLVPLLRLIKQDPEGIPQRRRTWLRTWRTTMLPAGEISLNETVHDSAIARLGRNVPEASDKTVRDILYQPQTLVAGAGIEVPGIDASTKQTAVVESAVRSPPVRSERETRKRPGDIEIRIFARPKALATPAIEQKPAAEAVGPTEEPRAIPTGIVAKSKEAAPGTGEDKRAIQSPRSPAETRDGKSESGAAQSPALRNASAKTEPTKTPVATKSDVPIVPPKGADMPEATPAPKVKERAPPESPVASPQEPASGKVKVITVHGTGAGVPEDMGDAWWQKGSAFQKKVGEIVELSGDNVEVVPFHWGTGPNSETQRREAGRKLHEQLRGYDAQGIDYQLVGHSHGGSVIYDALLRSVAKSQPLERLKSWLTIGTPFLDFQPSRSLFSRLNLWGQVVYVTGIGFLLLALGILAARIFDFKFAQMVTDALGEKADATFYFPLLTFMFGYVALCWIGLFIAELLTRRWYSNRHKTKVRDLYEGSWVGLFHHDDEAISALANVRSLNNAIIPTNFLVPMFSLIPLLITIGGVGYILFVLVHSVGPGTPELKNAIAQLGTGAPENELKWDLHSLGSVLSDLLKLVIFIMGPVLAGYLLLTTLGVGLFRAFAHMIGIPLAKAIDNLVWDSVRQDTWGNDRRGERVRGVSTHPPLFAPRYVALPDAIASKLTSNSERYATETMHKVREVLGATATVPTANDIGRDLSQQLSWKGLIHTTYFDSDEFIDLFAAAMRRAGLDPAKTGSTKRPVSEELVQQWLKDIAVLPAADTAGTPATAWSGTS